jgi:hypothetical protein
MASMPPWQGLSVRFDFVEMNGDDRRHDPLECVGHAAPHPQGLVKSGT